MSFVESQWWLIELPPEWKAEQSDDTIVITDEDGVGEIILTTLEKQQGVVSDIELQEYTLDLDNRFGESPLIKMAGFEGYYYSYCEEGEAVREWYLRQGALLVLITYSCDESDGGMDDSAVDEILSTLLIKQEEH